MFFFPIDPVDKQIATTPTGQNFMWNVEEEGWRAVRVAHYSYSPLTVSLFALGIPANIPLGGGNGVGPYTYEITGGALPVGIFLNSSSGVLSGVATSIGAYSFTVTATDSMAGTGYATFSGSISN